MGETDYKEDEKCVLLGGGKCIKIKEGRWMRAFVWELYFFNKAVREVTLGKVTHELKEVGKSAL